MINKDAKIYIAGHTGLVGSAIIRNLNNKGFNNIITRTHQQLDLTNQSKVREFLYIDDLADACVYIMNINKQKYIKHTKSMLSHVNVGVGYDITINELAQTIKKVVGYEGDIDFDNTKPDGSPQKLLDSSLINDLGWNSSIEIKKGLTKTYKAFQHLIKK